jgi:poly(3-hydroxybutyrate) depolymerase
MQRIDVGRDERGELRSYWVHRPDGAPDPAPIVFVFHDGKNTNGMQVARYWTSAWDQPFLLVFPDGQRSDPSRDGWDLTDAASQVDIAARMVEDAVEKFHGDERRLYAVGLGAGADLVGRLACDRSNLFRAVGRVAGTAAGQCPSRAPQIWVGADPGEPFASAAGCAGPPAVSTLPDRGDAVTVEVRDWTGCEPTPAARVVVAPPGQWPTGGRVASEAPVLDYDATAGILEFFRQRGGL